MHVISNVSSLVHQRSVENLMAFLPTRILSQSITPAASVLKLWVTCDENKTAILNNTSKTYRIFFTISALFACSPIYLTVHCQNHCSSSTKQQTLPLQFPPLQYCKQGHSKTLTCPKLLGNSSHAFFPFFRSMPPLKSLHCFPMHFRFISKICKSSLHINIISMSDACFCKKFQTATINQ